MRSAFRRCLKTTRGALWRSLRQWNRPGKNRPHEILIDGSKPPFFKQTFLQYRSHLYRYQNVRKLNAKFGDSACWRISRKELPVLFIKAGEVVRHGQQDVDLHNILKLR